MKVDKVQNTGMKQIYNGQGHNHLGRTGSAPPLGRAGLVLSLAQCAHMRGQRLT